MSLRAAVGRGRARGALVAVLAAAVAGAVAGWWTPRGPASSTQALSAMAIGATVGVIAGTATRSRWAMLLAPAVFVGVFEAVRLDATGPTVDAINVSEPLGMMAFGVGRLFHGVLALLPMVVGVAFGRASVLRSRHDGDHRTSVWSRSARRVRRGLLIATTFSLVLLGIAIVRPASTDAILGPDGKPLAGSIAELARVEVGGHEQALLIRGASIQSPVLLFLAGGPGGTELGTMRRYGGLLEQDFVVVTWDQRGTGKSYGSFEPATSLTFEQVVADTIELTDYLRSRFGEDKIYLASNSYGALLGVRAVQARPDLFAAFVGTGQMVSIRETDRMFYEDTLAYARQTGDATLVETLLAQGPPPYDDLLDYTPLVAGERDWNDYERVVEGHQGRREPSENLFVSEYSVMEKVASAAGLFDTYSVLYPQLQSVDLRRDAPRLDVPVYLAQGTYEARGRAVLAEDWFEQLEAPSKQLIVFDRSGHRPFAEEPERFYELMTETVLAETWTGPRPATVTIDPSVEPDNELLDLFTRYNRAIWPAHLVAYGFGLLALAFLLRRPGATTSRFVAGVLAAMWLWLGVVFQARYAAQIDALLGAVYATLFIGQALLFVRAGVVRRTLTFTTGRGIAGGIGWLALAYALVVYPLLGVALGHGYPEAPLFGVAPCPTTIATFGLLLLARPPLPRHLLTIPFVWAILAPIAAVGHGVVEDVGLFIFGIAAVIVVLVRDRGRHAVAPPPGSTPADPGDVPVLSTHGSEVVA